ncbi:hypothetical protein Dsin_008494 [Dipteronia sinensis]|uniref:Uncharacterized protein n=1 Tax=Dipteronia sinensis TaxID=43782 RepID=A0AAE0EAZ7_9ROSI|nr:hypothetical protein Dsin_008494 [Dipteronia sinensis]
MPEAHIKHIAVFAFPFTTHAAPLLSLVRKLSESAPNVKFCLFNTAKSNRSFFYKDVDFERVKPQSVDIGLPEGCLPTRALMQEPIEYFLKAMPENFKRAMTEIRLAFDGLITDAFFWFAKDMADQIRVLWIPYFTVGPRAMLVHVVADDLRAQLGINGPEEQTLDFLAGFSAIRSMDVPEGIISGSLDCPLATMMNKMGQMLPHASAIAINSFEEINPIVVQTLKSRLSNFLNIDWLDQHPRSLALVVYISFGSVITPPPHELEALAEALEACKFPFLWSFRGNVEEKFPKRFLERTKEKGLISRAQPEDCGESVGVGVGVEGGKFTKKGAIKALQVILSSKKRKLMTKKIGVLKQLAFTAADTDGSSIANFNFVVDFISKR